MYWFGTKESLYLWFDDVRIELVQKSFCTCDLMTYVLIWYRRVFVPVVWWLTCWIGTEELLYLWFDDVCIELGHKSFFCFFLIFLIFLTCDWMTYVPIWYISFLYLWFDDLYMCGNYYLPYREDQFHQGRILNGRKPCQLLPPSSLKAAGDFITLSPSLLPPPPFPHADFKQRASSLALHRFQRQQLSSKSNLSPIVWE